MYKNSNTDEGIASNRGPQQRPRKKEFDTIIVTSGEEGKNMKATHLHYILG
jgi:hypothetical protein